MAHEDIQQQGASARALGASEFDNPLYKPECMPATTREPISEWEAKATAWARGWQIEDLIRD